MLDPEVLNLAALKSVALDDRAKLPPISAIYFCLSEDNELLYIGRSTNILRRWVQHHRYTELKAASNVRIAWVEVSDPSLLSSVETALISHFNPSLNRKPVKIHQVVVNQISSQIDPRLKNLELGRGKRPKLNHVKLVAKVSKQTKEALEVIARQYDCLYAEEPWIAGLLTKIGSGELMIVPGLQPIRDKDG